jgi:hypothetical protein
MKFLPKLLDVQEMILNNRAAPINVAPPKQRNSRTDVTKNAATTNGT